MTGLDALQSVQFVTAKGKRFAVLSAEDWEALVEWLETLEDAQIARQAFAELKAFGEIPVDVKIDTNDWAALCRQEREIKVEFSKERLDAILVEVRYQDLNPVLAHRLCNAFR